MNILLINPGFKQIYGYTKEGSSILPSLGLLSIAAVVREIRGVEVEYSDCEIENEDIAEKLSKKQYDIIGVTGVSSYFPAMFRIAREIKEAVPSIPIIAGGVHATLCYEDVLQYGAFDAIVLGEGEEVMRILVERYKQGNDVRQVLEDIPYVVTRQKREADIAFVRDLDTLPSPAFDLVKWEKYSPSVHRSQSGKLVSIMTSRGCPFNCRYCKTPSEVPYRCQSAARVLKEVEYVVSEIGADYLQFWDDTFTFNRKRAIEIAKGLEKFDISWSINTRPDCVDQEMLSYLRRAGCSTIFYGVESSNEEILKKLNRTIKTTQIRNAFDITNRTGIKTVAGCILGLPYDTPEQILENITFVESLEPDFVHFSMYSPNPQTYLHQECVEAELFPCRMDWLDCGKYHGPPMGMPTCNPYLNRQELQEFLRYAYSLFPSCQIKAERLATLPNSE